MSVLLLEGIKFIAYAVLLERSDNIFPDNCEPDRKVDIVDPTQDFKNLDNIEFFPSFS